MRKRRKERWYERKGQFGYPVLKKILEMQCVPATLKCSDTDKESEKATDEQIKSKSSPRDLRGV